VIANVDNPNIPVKFYDEEAKDTLFYNNIRGDGIADLYIKEYLKGKPGSSAHIQVTYEANMVCPAPANYPDGKMVLAFLVNDTGALYHTVGLSYGAKEMDSEEDMNAYKVRIMEYLDILKLKTKQQRELATVEWLVKCAENKVTRWEGIYELSGSGDFMSDDDDGAKAGHFNKILSGSQKERLATIFFAADTIGYSELSLANLLPEGQYAQLRAHLVAGLSYADYYTEKDIMKKIIELFPDKELQQIYEAVKKISYKDPDRSEQQQELVNKFISVARKS
jgi:hypothetical protein